MTDSRFEHRYAVLKVSDVEKYLGGPKLVELMRDVRKVNSRREKAGKPPLRGVFIREGWPEYEAAARALHERITGGNPLKIIPATEARSTASAVNMSRLEGYVSRLMSRIETVSKTGETSVTCTLKEEDSRWVKSLLRENGYVVEVGTSRDGGEHLTIRW